MPCRTLRQHDDTGSFSAVTFIVALELSALGLALCPSHSSSGQARWLMRLHDLPLHGHWIGSGFCAALPGGEASKDSCYTCCVENALNLRNFLECKDCELIVTDDKDGDSSGGQAAFSSFL